MSYGTGFGAALLGAGSSGRSSVSGRGAGRDRRKQGRQEQGRFLASFAALALGAAALLLSPASLGAAHAQRLLQIGGARHTTLVTVAFGKTEDVRIDAPFSDISIGDPDVADVTPLTDRTLSILGKKIGTTRVSIYSEGKVQVGIFDIEVTYDVTRLATEIDHFAGGSIKVSSVNGRIMLSGKAQDAATLDRAMMMARQFAPEPINTVEVMQAQQVMLEVRFVEASRQASRELGVQWNSFGQNTVANIGNQVPANQLPLSPGNITAAGLLSGVSGTAPFGFLLGMMNKGNLSVDVALNALEQKGLARSLAEPNLVALSGDTASFLAGGEFPYPVPGGTLGAITIDFKRYGVGLAFTPTVLKDVINLKIEPEVSQLDTSHPVQIAGLSVPPLIVRHASTTVELRDGQSFMMAGLLQNDSTTAQDQLPWIGDMPVLGALFRSDQYQKNETDLAIIVTPHIIRPIAPGSPVKTPLDNTLPANDIDFFLMGKSEITPADARMAIGQQQRPYVGHMLDLPKGGANVVAVKD